MSTSRILIGLGLAAILLSACRKEPLPNPYAGYPEDIGEILISSCANVGCHDDNSYQQEGRLSLASWESAFQGSRSGAAIVPYRTDQSYLLFFANTFPELGIVQTPTMPLGGTPLSKEQILRLNAWIADGAPNADGQVKFADDPDRSKIYVANQGCDQVAVFDRETRLVMRYVDIGRDPLVVESPHYIRVSEDGRHWYVIFLAGNPTIEKYDSRTDELVGRINLGTGDWNTFAFSPDGRWAFCVDLGGRVETADLINMADGPGFNVQPGSHGGIFSPDGNKYYITDQNGNGGWVLTFAGGYDQFDNLDPVDWLQWDTDTGPANTLGIHEILFSPDGTKYAITCQYANQVRIFSTQNDSLLARIDVGAYPSELDNDPASGLFFVTCSEDQNLFPGDPLRRGSVDVIDWQSMTLRKSIYTGYQPHGVEVDEEKRLVYIANRNANPNGPAPHHSTDCGGRNGYVTAIDINTLELLDGFKHEVSVDPYAIALKK